MVFALSVHRKQQCAWITWVFNWYLAALEAFAQLKLCAFPATKNQPENQPDFSTSCNRHRAAAEQLIKCLSCTSVWASFVLSTAVPVAWNRDHGEHCVDSKSCRQADIHAVYTPPLCITIRTHSDLSSLGLKPFVIAIWSSNFLLNIPVFPVLRELWTTVKTSSSSYWTVLEYLQHHKPQNTSPTHTSRYCLTRQLNSTALIYTLTMYFQLC